jgi:hypothetical protein
MKRLKDPYTPLIAVTMMLIAVVAVMFFTEPPKEPEPPSTHELAPVLGEWVPAWADSKWSSDYLRYRFTLWDTMHCNVGWLNNKLFPYEYDPDTQIVTVKISETAEENATYRMTKHSDFTVLQQGEQYYVRQAEYQAFRKHLAIQEDLQPPVIVQRTEAELAPILGEWKGVMVGNIQYSVQSVVFGKDMTCTVQPNTATYSYNYDPETGMITVYTSVQKSYATKYQIAEIQGFPVLVNRNKTGIVENFTWNDEDVNYVRPKDWDAVLDLYHDWLDNDTFEGKLKHHQATRKILLEGKSILKSNDTLTEEGYINIESINGGVSLHRDGRCDAQFAITCQYLGSESIRYYDLLKNLRIVTTSIFDNWSQADLEESYSLSFSTLVMADAQIGPDDMITPGDDGLLELLFWFPVSATVGSDGEGPEWNIHDLKLQDFFVFFELPGEDTVYCFEMKEHNQ